MKLLLGLNFHKLTKFVGLVDLSVQAVQAGRAVAWLVGMLVGEHDMFGMVGWVVARCRVFIVRYSQCLRQYRWNCTASGGLAGLGHVSLL